MKTAADSNSQRSALPDGQRAQQQIDNRTAKKSGTPSIGIYFHNRDIGMLFAELLMSRGIQTRLLDTLEDLGNAKIITEPRFYNDLNPANRRRALVVGGLAPLRGHQGATLLQPLTEEKVEAALAQFLDAR